MEFFHQIFKIISWAFLFFTFGEVSEEEEAGKLYLKFYGASMSPLCYESTVASWKYATNITKENQAKMVDTNLEITQFKREAIANFTKFNWSNFTDENTKRQFKIATTLGYSALPDYLKRWLNHVMGKMEEIYSTTKICEFNNSQNCEMQLEPEITNLLMQSKNYEELLDAWTQWHDRVGQPIKPYYIDYVNISNQAAKLNGMNDTGEWWRDSYEDKNFENHVKELWSQLKPFYLQLHAYIRRKLVEIYGEDYVSKTGPIPAHLLGNMWAQDWSSLYNQTKPIQFVDESDATTEMVYQNYTVKQMFRMAEDFFTSLGMEPMTDEFWNNSMFERPKDRQVVCHASAWDFCNGQDFRIKMCAEVNYKDLMVVHHEMGHIQYFQQYKNQPYLLQAGANPAFHEAIGELIALSLSTKKHLAKFNLSSSRNEKYGEDINFLFKMALKNLAFLPFGYVVDYWRWRVFREEIPESEWNEEWWKMRREYQGIAPAVPRKSIDFDPAAKYHVSSSVSYVRYFVAYIIQYQFHKALCEIAGEYDASDPTKPLHHCDIYNSTAAGSKLSEALKLGSSKPWLEVMQILVGKREMDAAPFMEYFKPLIEYLVNDNKKHNAKIGWD